MSASQTLRGEVSNLKYIEKTGREMRYIENPDNATTITFEVGGQAVSAMNSGFPAINEGDDVEVTGAVGRGGMEVAQLHNHTTGADWKFSPWGAAGRSFFRGR